MFWNLRCFVLFRLIYGIHVISSVALLGFLISDYLRGSATPLDYCNSLAAAGHQYNAFNILVGDMR